MVSYHDRDAFVYRSLKEQFIFVDAVSVLGELLDYP